MSAFRKVSLWLVAYLLIPASLLVQVYFLQPYPIRVSPRWAVLILVLFLLTAGFLWLQYRFILAPLWKRLTGQERVAYTAFAGILALLLVITLSPDKTDVMEKFPHLAPVERLEVRPVLVSPNSSVAINEVMIGTARLANADLQQTGIWQEEGTRLRTSDPDAALIVEEKVPEYIRIKFLHAPGSGKVRVLWDGNVKEIDLSESEPRGGYFDFRFDVTGRTAPLITGWIRLLTLPGWFCLALFALSPFFAGSSDAKI